MIKKRSHIPSYEEAYLHARFTIDCNGCWVWNGHISNHGYAIAILQGRPKRLAHRVSYEVFVGPIPKGNGVYHECDNPPCINPEHLFTGTQADNMRDMAQKGRARKVCGVDHPKATLSDEQVAAILHDTATNTVVAAKHGVSPSVVWSIKTGRTWRHVTGIGA